jgi:imidazolonepropionase-like amidohydrolase
MTWTVRGAHVLDAAGEFGAASDVVVSGDRIAEVRASGQAARTPSIDAGGWFLLPGFTDCHVHAICTTLDIRELLQVPITRRTLQAAGNLRATLQAGVTFVRDAGGLDAGVRTALERGEIAGPRVQVSGVGLTQTGGHYDGFLSGPGREMTTDALPSYPGRPDHIVDGTDSMRKAVRQLVRAGADWIKVFATGGVTGPHDDPDAAEFTADELEVAVAEAARRNKGVMAHAFGGEGLDQAVRAGVRSIEHGIFLTEEQAQAMAKAGCWLVPTLSILHEALAWARAGTLAPASARAAFAVEPHIGEAVAIARAHGVRIAMGTDALIGDHHGANLRELAYMKAAGLSTAEALLAATRGGYELCGLGDELGRIAAGFVFDAVLLRADPSDLQSLAEPGAVAGVFQGGRPVWLAPDARERLSGQGWPQSSWVGCT